MTTGLKLGNGKNVKSGNLTTQAVSELKTEQNLSIISAGDSNGSKKIVSSDTPKKFSQFYNSKNNLNSPTKSLPFVQSLNAGNTNKIVGKDSVQLGGVLVPNVVNLKGINEERPEILSLTDFKPIFNNDKDKTLNSVGEFLDLQISARKLRVANIKKLLDKLSETPDVDVILQDLKEKYIQQISSAKKEVSFFISMLEIINSAKNSLKIKKYSSYSEQISNKSIRSFRKIFSEELFFSENNYKNFSNSKVYGQFLIDLYQICKTHSFSLFSNIDLSRKNDKHPTKFIKNTDISSGKYKFKIENFSSKSALFPVNMANAATFSEFVTQLPAAYDERILLLITLISKEMRVSQSLSKKNTVELLKNNFNIQNPETGNPFDEIIGQSGDKVTDTIIDKNSLMSLIFEDDKSLIFEQSYILDEDQKIYIPGDRYLIDSILSSQPNFDIKEITKYRNRFDSVTKNSLFLLKDLLNLNSDNKNLFCNDLLNIVIGDFASMLEDIHKSRIENQPDGISPGEYGLLYMAVLNLANYDIKLKTQLFQLMLLYGFSGFNSGGDSGLIQQNQYFQRLSKSEIKTFGDLSELNLSNKSGINQNLTFSNEDIPDVSNDEISINKDSLTENTTNSKTAAILLIDKIIDRLFYIVKNGKADKASSGIIIDYTKDEVKQMFFANNKIFNLMIQFLSTLDSKINQNENDYFTQDTFKTRFNLLTLSTRALMAFEIYSSFTKMYIDAGISSSNSNNTISFSLNVFKIDDVLSALKSVLGQESSFGQSMGFATEQKPKGQIGLLGNASPLNNNSFLESLKILKDKMIKEDDILLEFIGKLSKISEKIVNSLSNVIKFFTPGSENFKTLVKIASEIDSEEKFTTLSEAQIRLSQKELDDFETYGGVSFYSKESNQKSLLGNAKVFKNSKTDNSEPPLVDQTSKNSKYPAYFDDSDISFEVRDIMLDFLSKEKFNFKNGKNLKILSVGLPAGFSENLKKQLDYDSNNFEEGNNKEKDIIEINVYRKDIEFENITFKPKKYLFELSRFSSNSSIVSNFGSSINEGFTIAKNGHVFTKDYSKFVKGKIESIKTFFDDERYSFLTEKQKQSLIENHITSYIMEIYIKLLTGINLSESSFVINRLLMNNFIDENSRNIFKKIIETYVSGLSNNPVTINQLKNSSNQIKLILDKIDLLSTQQSFTDKIEPIELPGLSKSAKVSLTEDLITFIKLFNPKTFLTGGEIHKKKILTPKLFERIFHLAVDPDDFVADDPPSQNGNAVLQSKYSLNQSISQKFLNSNSENTIDFEQFFVTINTVGDEII